MAKKKQRLIISLFAIIIALTFALYVEYSEKTQQSVNTKKQLVIKSERIDTNQLPIQAQQAQSIEPWFRKQTEKLREKYIIERLSKDCERKIKKYEKLVEKNPNSKYYQWRLRTWRDRCDREHNHR